MCAPYCELHNIYLGNFKWMMEVQYGKLKRMGRDGNKILKKIHNRILDAQTEIRKICPDEPRISAFLKKDGSLNTTLWNGKEWRAFAHMALSVFSGLLDDNDMRIW